MYKKILLIVVCLTIGIAYAELVPISKNGVYAEMPNQQQPSKPVLFSAKTNLLEENFTSTTFPPTGWTRISLNVGDSTWHRRTTIYRSSPASAAVWWSWRRQNELLITPPVTLTGSPSAAYYLKWWYYGYKGSTYGDHYYTKIIVGNDTTVLYDLSSFTPPDTGWNYWTTPVVINLTPYAGQTVKIVWQAFDGYPTNVGMWYAWAIDDVEIGYLSANDVGVEQILTPGNFHQPGTLMTPSASIRNYGSATQTNFQTVCSIVGPGRFVYVSTKTVASLAGGATTTVTFDTLRPTTTGICTVKIRTNLAGDEEPANDRKTKTCNISNTVQIQIGTGTTSTAITPMYRYYNYSTCELIYLQSEINTSGTINAIAFNKASGTNVDPIENVTIYMKHTTDASLTSGTYDLTGYEQVYSGSFPNNATSGWMEVNLQTPFFYNNTENLRILIIKGYQAYISSGYPYWYYTSTTPNRVRYNYSDASQPTSLTAGVYLSNILLTITAQPPPTNDVGVQEIRAPGPNMVYNTPIAPIGIVKNYGTATQSFNVICSIIGPVKAVRYTDTKSVTNLAAGDTYRVVFANYTPTITEMESVIMRTTLANDENPTNDRKARASEVGYDLLIEGFEGTTFPPAGWVVYNNDGGTQTWIRNTTYPRTGVAHASCRWESSTLQNDDWLITPQIAIPAAGATLKFWYRNSSTSSPPDQMVVRLSTTGNAIPDFTVVLDTFSVSTTTYLEKVISLNAYAGQSIYLAFVDRGLYGWTLCIDDVRVQGVVGIEEEKPNKLPTVTTLNAPKPNPVIDGLAKISFAIAEPTRASLKIYDASGKLIKVLVNEFLSSGVYNFVWNGKDDNDHNVAEGIYFYTLTTDKENFTKKLVFTR